MIQCLFCKLLLKLRLELVLKLLWGAYWKACFENWLNSFEHGFCVPKIALPDMQTKITRAWEKCRCVRRFASPDTRTKYQENAWIASWCTEKRLPNMQQTKHNALKSIVMHLKPPRWRRAKKEARKCLEKYRCHNLCTYSRLACEPKKKMIRRYCERLLWESS